MPDDIAQPPYHDTPAAQDDHFSLTRLAALDSTEDVPAGRVLLAEVGGELRAALSLQDGSAISDPFRPNVIDLMRAHAKHPGRPRVRRRLRLRYTAS